MHYNTQAGIAEINGTQIAYDVTGSGHGLVFVHAGVANRHMWDDQVAAFAEHYRVVRFDSRGFGQTPLGAVPFSFGNDLYELLQFLKIERAYLVGCSMGGSMIIDFALEHPEMVAALVPVCSSPNGYEMTGDPPNLQVWIALEQAVEAQDWDRVAELQVQLWIDGPYRKPGEVDAHVRDRLREMVLTATTPDESKHDLPLDPPAVNRLGDIHIPVLVVVGDLDYPQLMDAANLMTERIPGARKAVIHTAHIPSIERPAEFNHLVLEFLRGCKTKSA